MHNSAAHKFTSIPSPQQQFTGNYLAVYFPFSARPKEMLRRHQEPAVFILHQPSQHPAHSYIPSTLPISLPKGRGNLGAGICAPAWVPSWLRGHHSPSARSPSEGTNLCMPHLTGQENKQGKMMENHLLCGIGATKLGLEKVGINRGRKTWNVPAISSTTPEKPGQPILVKSTTTSGSQAGIWMECCTTPFLITEDYSC